MDMAEIGNYGPGSEADQFLQNNEDNQGYGELQTPTDVEVFKTFAKEQIQRGRKGKREILVNSERNWRGL